MASAAHAGKFNSMTFITAFAIVYGLYILFVAVTAECIRVRSTGYYSSCPCSWCRCSHYEGEEVWRDVFECRL
jgi:hypothetical protein